MAITEKMKSYQYNICSKDVWNQNSQDLSNRLLFKIIKVSPSR